MPKKALKQMWHNKYGARIINAKGYAVVKRTPKTKAHTQLKDLDKDDLKLWAEDEIH